jgi:PKD repeat protein
MRAVLPLVAVLALIEATEVSATDFYVSPAGTTSTAPGTGTVTNPWALQTALAQPAAVHPGDTIWLRGGTYTGLFTSYLTGTSSLPIVVRQYSGERARLDGNVNPLVLGTDGWILKVNGAYTWYWGFEVMDSNPNRYNPTSGSNPVDARDSGIGVWGPGTKIINVVIHDTGEGLDLTSISTDSEYYGNIIYYNGWNAPDRPHGHAIYAQNLGYGGTKVIKHNILFDQFGYNLHAYGSGTSGFINSRVDGNVWWRGTSLVGGESGFDIGGTSVTGNFSWAAPLTMGYSTTKCANVTVSGNYLTNLGGGVFSSGSSGCRAGETITTNTFVGDLSGFTQGDYPNNTYYAKTSPPTQDKVTILPNAYEPGRATIVVNNWDGSATQAVDLTEVVSPGVAYEIRNAQNIYGPPVVSGTYAGGSVTLPMTGLTPATPVGYAAPPSTGPAFGVFVVLSASLGPPSPPTASFTYSPATPTANAPVTFTDTSTGNPTTWQWSFGDGGTSTQRNPTHTYAASGTLTVTLTAVNSAGSNQTSRSLGVTLRSIPPTPSGFHTLSPCRVIDTRNANGPTGGPTLAASSVRIFPVAGSCGIPANARTVSVNLTVTNTAAPGDLRVYPTDIGIPETWTISFGAGRTRANNAMLTLATDGSGTIGVKNDAPGTVHVIVDVNGYFK